jgi:hypothetical protein
VLRDLAVCHGLLGDWQNAMFWSEQSHLMKRRIRAIKPVPVAATTVLDPRPVTVAKPGTAKPGTAKPGLGTAKPDTVTSIDERADQEQEPVDLDAQLEARAQELVAELANLPVPLHTDTAHQALPLVLPIRTMPQPFTVVKEDTIEYLPVQSTPLMWYQGTLAGQVNGLWRTPSQSLQSWQWSEGLDYVCLPAGDALTGCLVVLNGISMHVILNSNREYYRSIDGLIWQPDPSLAGKFDECGFIKTHNYPQGRVIPQRPPTPPPAFVAAPPPRKVASNCWATAKTLGSPTHLVSPTAPHNSDCPVSPLHVMLEADNISRPLPLSLPSLSDTHAPGSAQLTPKATDATPLLTPSCPAPPISPHVRTPHLLPPLLFTSASAPSGLGTSTPPHHTPSAVDTTWSRSPSHQTPSRRTDPSALVRYAVTETRLVLRLTCHSSSSCASSLFPF